MSEKIYQIYLTCVYKTGLKIYLLMNLKINEFKIFPNNYIIYVLYNQHDVIMIYFLL